ncbi:MAG: DUF6465 family protein [Butyrivibrio sp.]|nr:DUF6465 family protein [Muribaculum sp.]MCM1551110.1 DUF6465 family protein [Butyrivibrio sp.]
MAAAKKTVKPVAVATQASAPVEKAEVSATKKVEPTTTVQTEEKAEKPAAAKKETVKKETVKKETVKKAPAKRASAKKTTAKKETKAAATRKTSAKKADLNSKVHIEFPDKSYTQEDLIKIAKDVWKYDLKQKVSDLTSIDLYVKAEEKTVYYVMNMEFKGSFGI